MTKQLYDMRFFPLRIKVIGRRIERNTVFLLFENSNLKSRAIKIRRDESSARQKSFRAGEIGGRYSVAT